MLIEFSLPNDCKDVLEKGHWFLNGHVLIIKIWDFSVELKQDLFKTLPLSVTFPKLGSVLWDEEALGIISSVIGYPLFIDHKTLKKEEMIEAKACIMVNADSPMMFQSGSLKKSSKFR